MDIASIDQSLILDQRDAAQDTFDHADKGCSYDFLISANAVQGINPRAQEILEDVAIQSPENQMAFIAAFITIAHESLSKVRVQNIGHNHHYHVWIRDDHKGIKKPRVRRKG